VRLYYNTQTDCIQLDRWRNRDQRLGQRQEHWLSVSRGSIVINKEGQVEFQLNKNPWKLINIIDWNKAGQPK
jgi:hypothetical protein